MKHTIDELMLQRCVDGELTDLERAELLTQLHEQGSAENWKTLALSFIEHQVFSKVFTEDSASGEMLSFHLARPATPGQTPKEAPATPVHWLHRRVRPWFSIAASLAAGMLVGVGGYFIMDKGDEGTASLANVATVSSPSSTQLQYEGETAGEAAGTHAGQPPQHVPMVHVQLTGLGGGTTESVAIPVFSPDQWQAYPPIQPSVALPPELHQMLESRGLRLERQHQWYRARLHDGREVLVPTEIMHVRNAVQ